MSVQSASRFFAVLALFTAAATVCVWAAAAWSIRHPDGVAARAIADVQHFSLWLAFSVAAVTSGGSLYYSLGAGFEPCELCWYQRICIYPTVVLLLIGAVRRDFSVWRYAIGLVAIGITIATYHTQLQAYPKQQTFCSATVPCTARYVWEFGFVSLPLMDLIALSFIATMLFAARAYQDREVV